MDDCSDWLVPYRQRKTSDHGRSVDELILKLRLPPLVRLTRCSRTSSKHMVPSTFSANQRKREETGQIKFFRNTAARRMSSAGVGLARSVRRYLPENQNSNRDRTLRSSSGKPARITIIIIAVRMQMRFMGLNSPMPPKRYLFQFSHLFLYYNLSLLISYKFCFKLNQDFIPARICL